MVRPEITVLHLLRLKLKYYGKSKYHSYWKVCLWSVISARKYLPFRIPVYKRLFVCFKRIFTLDLCFNTELINSYWLTYLWAFNETKRKACLKSILILSINIPIAAFMH